MSSNKDKSQNFSDLASLARIASSGRSEEQHRVIDKRQYASNGETQHKVGNTATQSHDSQRRTHSSDVRRVQRARTEITVERPRRIEKPNGEKRKPNYKTYKSELNFINSLAVLVVIFGTFFALFFMNRESGFVESENRNYADFPKFSLSNWFNGDFTAGITNYYTDTFPSREKLKPFASDFSELFGVSHSGGKIIGQKGEVDTNSFNDDVEITKATAFTGTRPIETSGSSSTNASKTPDTTTSPTSTDKPATTLDVENPEEHGTLSNGILIVGKGEKVRAIELYGGSFDWGKKYAQYVNKYKETLGQYVNVYSMCIPTSFAYYLPTDYRSDYGKQLDNINNIRSNLKNVVDIDAYSALEAHKREYIYSRTDHHWQPIGAYYAAEKFAEAAGVQYSDISTYQKVTETDFLGTLYSFSGNNAELAKYPDTFTYYKPSNNSSLKVTYYDKNFQNPEESVLFFKAGKKINLYSTFLGTDQKIAKIDTNVKNGRVLVIFKDSFGNALVPFLTESFQTIYVCDLRYFTPNAISFIKNVGASDVLFATCMFTNTGKKANYIENLRIQ